MYIPNKLRKYFGTLEKEDGLIDDCKYILYFADGYKLDGEYQNVPVRSQKEAIEYLENVSKYYEKGDVIYYD